MIKHFITNMLILTIFILSVHISAAPNITLESFSKDLPYGMVFSFVSGQDGHIAYDGGIYEFKNKGGEWLYYGIPQRKYPLITLCDYNNNVYFLSIVGDKDANNDKLARRFIIAFHTAKAEEDILKWGRYIEGLQDTISEW